MKKLLLIAAMLLGILQMWGTTDGVTYPEVNGIKIANQWIKARLHAANEFNQLPFFNNSPNYVRTAVLQGDEIYVSHSNVKVAIVGSDTLAQCVVYKLSASDCSVVAELPLTLDGAPYVGAAPLGSNNIGKDNFGHIYVAPYTSEAATTQAIYLLNTVTGELSLVAQLEKGDVLARTDYIDVIGDLTREQAECNIMSVGASVATIYRWHADQNGDFEGGFEGDTYMDITTFYPETVLQWGYGPVVKMCMGTDEETMYSGELFYVDGFSSAPILYDVTGSMVDSFDGVPEELLPWSLGANGVVEFHVNDHNYVAYAMAQYEGMNEATGNMLACQVNICELGEDMTLAGMTKCWMVPDVMGTTSDSGSRLQCMSVDYEKDADGNDVVNLLVYKCSNGIALYKIGVNVGGAEPVGVPGDVNGDGLVSIADANAVISIILNGADSVDAETLARADVNGDGLVTIADANAVISIILNG